MQTKYTNDQQYCWISIWVHVITRRFECTQGDTSVRIDVETRQPTVRHDNTSLTKAT